MKKHLITCLAIAAFFTGCAATNNSNNNSVAKMATPNAESAETLRIANAYMGAMNAGDMETMVSLMHDNMVWQNAGDTSMPWIGPWNGKQAILEQFFPSFMENFETVKWDSEDAFSSGDTAAYFGSMIGRLKKSGKETNEFPFALRVKVKDGKIILWNWFEDSYEVSKAFHGK